MALIAMALDIEQGTQADFFVHPDFHRVGWYPMDAEVEHYEDALRARIETSTLPVLVYDPSAAEHGDFWELFPSEQRFSSEGNYGYLEDEGDTIPRFNALLTERTVLSGVVHGSYLEACVRHFKRSLRASRATGLLYFSEQASREDIAEPGTVKYGLVLSARNIVRRPVPEFEDLLHGLPPAYYADDARIFYTSQR